MAPENNAPADQPKRPPLAERVTLPRVDRQSSGELYETFLAWNRDTRARKIQKWHHYFDVYERHLARFRGTRCRLMEFGVMDGGSLELWSEYLGPDAEIIGIEINPKARAFDRLRPNIRVVTADQSDMAALETLSRDFGPIDIVIDDGGHTARQQIRTFNGMYASVEGHGVYICEDTHTSYWPDYMDAGDRTMMEHAKALIDEMHVIYRPDVVAGKRYATPLDKRQGDLLVSRFAATTYSIQFYDSMIVFEKRPRAEPLAEFR
ncbi:MAG: hypothetical protein P1U88_15280 [Thalassobaculaceae bacterium]|nr:hypothetical protein [Thalassobaculaceae bacterium]